MTSTKEQVLQILQDKGITPVTTPIHRPTSEEFHTLEAFKKEHGLTDPQMSLYCGVGVSTLTSWRQRFKTKSMFNSEGIDSTSSQTKANEKLLEDILEYFKANVSDEITYTDDEIISILSKETGKIYHSKDSIFNKREQLIGLDQ